MHKWMLTWILPVLLYRSYFYLLFLVSNVSLACNEMTPEQMAASVNCSSPERHTRSYDYMEGGNVRVRRLFCRTQWYIKIDKRGKIKGVLEQNNNYKNCFLIPDPSSAGHLVLPDYFTGSHFLSSLPLQSLPGKYWELDDVSAFGILEIRTVAVGIVAIKGVASEYFLAMNKSGKLYGKKVCNEDCNFVELIQENHYNTYASANWTHKGKEMYIALKQNGAPKRGQKTSKEDIASHFLPLALS